MCKAHSAIAVFFCQVSRRSNQADARIEHWAWSSLLA
jgi:hypothetical protein